MQITTLLPLIASFLSLSNAAALERPATWKATNWDIGCSGGGCVYSFNISAAGTANTPAFETYCEGIPGNTTLCADHNITSKVTKMQHPTWQVAVQHDWLIITNDKYYERFSSSGTANVTDSTKTFSISPNVFLGA